MSSTRVDILKDRARAFLQLAEELIARGRLDIASFCIEQACQLRLKATLLRLFNEIPKIHGIKELLGILAKRLDDVGYSDLAEEVSRFVREHRDTLTDIEEAYTQSRYGISIPMKRDIEQMLSTARKLFDFLDEVEKRVLG